MATSISFVSLHEGWESMGNSKRTVICHHHIFKNSGTTFDHLLQENYGEEFLEFDGPFRFSKISQDELLKVATNSSASAISCHQINLPVPTSVEVAFLPVVFIRHPLLRLRSIHCFSLESPDTTAAAAVEKQPLAAWVAKCTNNPSLLQILSNARISYRIDWRDSGPTSEIRSMAN
ncbi:MAG: hypothetical protein ABR578_01555 [Chromatocurvus sp.]